MEEVAASIVSPMDKLSAWPCLNCHNPSKYRCPDCEITNCSLHCVKKHKIKDCCDGIRNKTSFVRIQSFTYQHLLNDYRMLEEVDRAVSRKVSTVPVLDRNQQYQRHIDILKKAAISRGIQLHLPPFQTSRQLTNSTRVLRNSYRGGPKDIILWHIELVFQEWLVQIEKVDETFTLQGIVGSILDPLQKDEDVDHLKELSRMKGFRISLDSMKGISVFRQQLATVSFSIHPCKFHCVLRKPLTRNKISLYWKLDMASSLDENLKDKVIQDFPVIHLVLDGDLKKFPTNEAEASLKNGFGVSEERRTKDEETETTESQSGSESTETASDSTETENDSTETESDSTETESESTETESNSTESKVIDESRLPDNAVLNQLSQSYLTDRAQD